MDAVNLSALRAEERADLETTGAIATVYSATVTEDEIGGTTQVDNAGTAYPCNLQAQSQPREGAGGGGQQSGVTTWVCFLPWNAVVKPENVLTVGGIRYQVVDTNEGETNRLVLKANLVRAK
jgi:hypothetical protein